MGRSRKELSDRKCILVVKQGIQGHFSNFSDVSFGENNGEFL